MNIVFFYYDGFAGFEMVQSCFLLADKEPMFAALEDRSYRSMEGLCCKPDRMLSGIDPSAVDLFVIPGGDSSPLFDNAELKAFIAAVLAADKTVAGICGGSELLAALGFLKGRRCTGNTDGVRPTDPTWKYYQDAILVEEQVVTDGNVISAQGQAFSEFAIALARVAGVYATDQEAKDGLDWLRNVRSVSA